MNPRKLRTPEQRVGTLPNAALPPPDEEPPSTETLLRRALLEGDDDALAVVVHDLRPEMLRLAARHVGSHEEAEDVVQDTWIAAIVGIERFEGRASLRTWLLRILTYRARSTARHRGRSIPLSRFTRPNGTMAEAARVDPFLISAPPDPEALLMVRELREDLERALAELPGRQRQVVRLRDLEGWSPKEVCASLRLSAENQRVLLHRGRSQLREIVARWQPSLGMSTGIRAG